MQYLITTHFSTHCCSITTTQYNTSAIFPQNSTMLQTPAEQYTNPLLSTHQWSLSVCRKADSPSMHSRITTVATAQKANSGKMRKQPHHAFLFSPIRSTMFHSTSDSSAGETCGDKNHRDF